MLARSAFFVAVLAIAGPALYVRASAAAQCDQTRHTSVPVPVYEKPPEFSTGNGWTLGPSRLSLAPGVAVRLCESRKIGFLGGQRLWLYIRFATQGGTSEGWIFGEGTVSLAPRRAGPSLGAILGPAVAYAQGPAESPQSLGLPAEGTDWVPVVWGIMGVLVGMAAKGAFDSLQAGQRFVAREYLRRTTPALLISPIVFLSLAKVGNFGFAGAHSITVAFCVAFQSGFFWQTVLVRTGPQPSGVAPQAAAGA